ncbi:MAG: hypothetical protein RLZZ433_1824 [Pseudomonadota bacterium]
MWDIPHREHTPAIFVIILGSSGQILTIFVKQALKKLVNANVKNIFKYRKTLWFERDS